MKTEKQTSKQRPKTSMQDFFLAISKIEDIELTERELRWISGGTGNIMKSHYDTQKNSVSNIK
jgi:hypothetical protein